MFEQLEPEPADDSGLKPCAKCGSIPCTCPSEPEPPCYVCGNIPCICETPPRVITRVKLADGKVRELQHMVSTTFWSPDGKPISATEFLESLFGTIPELFKSEQELREIWSLPHTRKNLLDALHERGFSKEQLEEFQKILHAENSDLYDVLAYVAFRSQIVPREVRAEDARTHLKGYDTKQIEFVNFVLSKYVSSGVYELDESNLRPLLLLKYKTLSDAKKELGMTDRIRKTFISFQAHLYSHRPSI